MDQSPDSQHEEEIPVVHATEDQNGATASN